MVMMMRWKERRERRALRRGSVFAVVGVAVRGHTSKRRRRSDDRGRVWKPYETTGRENGRHTGRGEAETGERKEH